MSCPNCGTLWEHEDTECPFDRLVVACGPLLLTPEEFRTLRWLARSEFATVDTLEQLFRRLREVRP